MSKIDWHNGGRPALPTIPSVPDRRPVADRPASENQIGFLVGFLDKDVPENLPVPSLGREYHIPSLAADLADSPQWTTTREASALIDTLMSLPRRPLPESEKATPGYYVQGDAFIVVVENKAKTGTYAKRLTNTGSRWTWEYAPGVGRTLAGLAPLTIDAAKAFGHLHGVCIVCTKTLTDPKSVEAGIGPVCAKRLH